MRRACKKAKQDKEESVKGNKMSLAKHRARSTGQAKNDSFSVRKMAKMPTLKIQKGMRPGLLPMELIGPNSGHTQPMGPILPLSTSTHAPKISKTGVYEFRPSENSEETLKYLTQVLGECLEIEQNKATVFLIKEGEYLAKLLVRGYKDT